MSDGVVRRHEILKNNIRTILNRLPSYIKDFPPEENEILTKFISVLQHFEEAEYQRDKLSARLEEYIKQNNGTNQYLRTPFLWYSVDFCINANIILNIAKFHAEEFFSYLTTYLRKTFQLVRVGISLSNSDAFESLQYECNKLHVPLTKGQIQALETLYSSINSMGYQALKPQRIKTAIYKKTNSSDLLRNIVNFFKYLDGKFFLLFNQRAFDLEHLYVKFRLNEERIVKDIIDFQDPSNTVLCNSEILEVKGDNSKEYLGLLVTSPQFCNSLINFLQRCVRQEKLEIHEMKQISMSRWSASLVLYQMDKGWGDLSSTQWLKLIRGLKTKNPRKTKVQTFFITPPFKPIWHYQLHDRPSEIIKLYCKFPRELTYEDLPFNTINNQTKNQFSSEELTLFKELHQNQVVYTGFRSDHLWYDWSLNAFWIELPLIPLSQLIRLLQWLPFTELFTNERNFCIYTRLPPSWAKRIKNDLDWLILPVMRYHYPKKLRYKWFDEETLQWKIPSVLKT